MLLKDECIFWLWHDTVAQHTSEHYNSFQHLREQLTMVNSDWLAAVVIVRCHDWIRRPFMIQPAVGMMHAIAGVQAFQVYWSGTCGLYPYRVNRDWGPSKFTPLELSLSIIASTRSTIHHGSAKIPLSPTMIPCGTWPFFNSCLCW